MPEALTDNYGEIVGSDHIARFGQYFTPAPVADFLCRWAMKSQPSHMFDPAFGLGALRAAAARIDPHVQFGGAEIDPCVLQHYRQVAGRDASGCNVVLQSYFDTWNTHQAIVCNPPYMRFQHFDDRHAVLPALSKKIGVKLSGYTNIASAFLAKSLSELKPGGRLAYIMPLEFLNTGYGTQIKQLLIATGNLRAVAMIEAESEVFPTVLTTVGIVLVEKAAGFKTVQFSKLQSLEALNAEIDKLPGERVPTNQLSADGKWLRHFAPALPGPSSRNEQRVPLSTYGTVSRGIATGANAFFSVPPSVAEQLRIPDVCRLPCVTRSNHVTRPVFENSDLQGLLDSDARVILLNLEAVAGNTAVRAYIESGEQQGIHTRYLTASRRPWYRLEQRQAAAIWLGVFNRGRFKVIRNLTAARSLTCFHGFYPNLIGHAWVDHLFLYLLSDAGQRAMDEQRRSYGGKLDKFEPRDLSQVLVPSPEQLEAWSASSVARAMEEVKRGIKPAGTELGTFLSQAA